MISTTPRVRDELNYVARQALFSRFYLDSRLYGWISTHYMTSTLQDNARYPKPNVYVQTGNQNRDPSIRAVNDCTHIQPFECQRRDISFKNTTVSNSECARYLIV